MILSKRPMLIGAFVVVLLVAIVFGGMYTSGANAQPALDADEWVALEAWGSTQDPNVTAFFATQDDAALDLSLGEAHFGYDKTSGRLLDDPTIFRATLEHDARSVSEVKEGSDIDLSRIRFGSDYVFEVTRGIAPQVYERLSRSAVSDTSQSYMVIQFNFPVDLQVKSQLEERGVSFGDPIDKLSFYARIPPSALPELVKAIDAGKVNFAGYAPAESRMSAALRVSVSQTPHATLRITLQLFDSPTSDQIATLQNMLHIIDTSDGPVHLIDAEIEATRVLNLLEQPFVQWVEEQTINESGGFRASPAASGLFAPAANLEGNLGIGGDILKQLGYDGTDIRVAVMDSGIARQGSTYHPDLPASRIIDQYFWDPNSAAESTVAADDVGHGTHVAGTIGGSGSHEVDQASQGQAPDVDFLIYRLSTNNSGFTDADFQASLSRGAANNMNISNNSWGGGNGLYNLNAQLSDRAVRGEFSNQYVNMVIITHNDNALTRSPGTAKNALTVGAVKDGNWPQTTFNWAACSDGDWPPAERICFSNFGPINADGDANTRVKPDIVAPGVRIRSSVPWYLSPFSYYDVYDGTSMAAPQVSGAAAQFLDAHPEFLTWPEVVKAAFIASATDVGGANVNQYGRGMLNAVHATLDQSNISDTSYWTGAVLSTGNNVTNTFTVPSDFKEVRVALTWADPVSGAGNDDVVNDLDVRVYDGNGSQVGLSTTVDDTVEYVKTTSGTPGTWSIVVRAFSISSSQPFGLAAVVVRKVAALSVSAYSEPASGTFSGGNFYLYSTLANSGFAAPGSYIRLQVPNITLFKVEGARVYTNDGRSHYYDDSELYDDSSGVYLRVAVGETISGYPRLVRWFMHYTGTDCTAALFNLASYFRSGEGLGTGGTSALTFFSCNTNFLPLILK